jgi:hypothetical protein
VCLRTFVSWLLASPGRRPHIDGKARSHDPGFHRLVPADLCRVKHFHVYAAQSYLEHLNWVRFALVSESFTRHEQVGTHIRTMCVTIRHTDFWWWEYDNGLRMDCTNEYGDEWRSGLDDLPNLEELTFELETLERRAREMDALVKEVKAWKITLKDQRVLSSDGIPVQTHTWLGSSQFSGGQTVPAGTTNLLYYVANVTWKAPQALI